MRLPKSVQQIADVIGSDKALRLVRQLPPCGKRARRRNLYIPKPERLDVNHRLVTLLGWDDALALCHALGGQAVQPALCRYMERAMTNRRILDLRDLGWTVAEIADELKMSEKWVDAVVEARAMHCQGIDVEVIAHAVRISPLTIGYILGIDVEPSDERVKPRGIRRSRGPQLELAL